MNLRSSLMRSLLLMSLVGCVPAPPSDPPSYAGEQSAINLAERVAVLRHPSIPGLLEFRAFQDSATRVTIRCDHTPMHLLLPFLAEQTGLSYRLGRISPVFDVSAQLQDLPVEEVLGVLFSGSDYEILPQPTEGGKIWVVRDRQQRSDTASSLPTTKLLNLQHIPAVPITQRLLGLGQNSGLIQGDGTVSAAAIDLTSVSLRGPQASLAGLTHSLQRADQSPPVILLRARKFATIEELITTYFGNPRGGLLYSGGPFISLALPNSTQSNIAIASQQQRLGAGAAYGQIAGVNQAPSSFSLTLSGLVQRIQENYYADTQLTVISGQSAAIQAGRTGYVLTPIYEDGFVVNRTQQVNAITSLTVTPTALPSGEIRLQLAYSTYRLIPNEFSLVGTVRGASQTAILQIPPGQPVIVSGSQLKRHSIQFDGWDHIRKLPLVGSLLQASVDNLYSDGGLLVVWAEILHPTDPRAQILPEIGPAPTCPVADDSRGVDVYRTGSLL